METFAALRTAANESCILHAVAADRPLVTITCITDHDAITWLWHEARLTVEAGVELRLKVEAEARPVRRRCDPPIIQDRNLRIGALDPFCGA